MLIEQETRTVPEAVGIFHLIDLDTRGQAGHDATGQHSAVGAQLAKCGAPL